MVKITKKKKKKKTSNSRETRERIIQETEHEDILYMLGLLDMKENKEDKYVLNFPRMQCNITS